MNSLYNIVRCVVVVAATTCCSIYCKAQPTRTADCFAALPSNSDLLKLKGKISLDLGVDPTFSMLTNSQTIQLPEKPVLVKWVELVSECFKSAEIYRTEDNPFSPRHRLIVDEFRKGIEGAVLKLYEKQSTYGDFSKRHKELKEDTASKFLALQQEYIKYSQNQAKISAENKARSDEQAQVKAREQARSNSESAAQASALATAQKIAVCRSARETMIAICKPVDDSGSGVTVNIGGQIQPAPKFVSPFDYMECQKWKDEVNMACR